MNVASLVLSASLAAALVACKPDPSSKPAAGSGVPAAPFGHDHARVAAPALPTAGSAGSAQAEAPPENRRPSLDKDGDGVVSPEERELARDERAKRMRDRFDANHDGKLTPDELAAASRTHQAPYFEDPKALDRNNDGEISPEELQKGLRVLRIQRRAEMMGGSD